MQTFFHGFSNIVAVKIYFKFKIFQGSALEPVAKSSAGVSTCHVSIPAFESWLHTWFQLCAFASSEKEHRKAYVVLTLPPICETWLDFHTAL